MDYNVRAKPQEPQLKDLAPGQMFVFRERPGKLYMVARGPIVPRRDGNCVVVNCDTGEVIYAGACRLVIRIIGQYTGDPE